VTNVLIADDEPLVRLAVRSLEDWKAAEIAFPYEAANGREALSLVASHPEIDVVLVDVDMPVMNGLELAEKLAEAGGGPELLFLSSFDTFDFARRAFKAGAHDYILKSEMDEGRLLAALRKIIERRGKTGELTRGPNAAERREELFSRLLADPPSDIADRLAEESFRAALPAVLMVLRPLDAQLVRDRYGEDPDSFRRVAIDLIRQSLALRPSGEALAVSFERYAALFSSREDAEAFFEDFSRAAWNYLDMGFEARVEGPVEMWSGLHASYAAAEGRFSVSSRLVVRARRYIRERYADPRLDLAAIAAYAEVSKNHLSWEFARETGENVSTFVARVRVEAAKTLLATTALKTYEIAEKVGYANVETFCRVFKKITGTTPRGFPA
jgi:YesN/AraC family two-component response regulator